MLHVIPSPLSTHVLVSLHNGDGAPHLDTPQLPTDKKAKNMCVCARVCVCYPSAAEVHGMFDDVVVVVQLERLGVHGLVEGPGVRRVLLGQQLLQDAGAEAQVLGEPAALGGVLRRLLLLRQRLAGRLDGAARALPPLLLQRRLALGRRGPDGGAGARRGREHLPLQGLLVTDAKPQRQRKLE